VTAEENRVVAVGREAKENAWSNFLAMSLLSGRFVKVLLRTTQLLRACSRIFIDKVCAAHGFSSLKSWCVFLLA